MDLTQAKTEPDAALRWLRQLSNQTAGDVVSVPTHPKLFWRLRLRKINAAKCAKWSNAPRYQSAAESPVAGIPLSLSRPVKVPELAALALQKNFRRRFRVPTVAAIERRPWLFHARTAGTMPEASLRLYGLAIIPAAMRTGA
jgi:hypothetical protein